MSWNPTSWDALPDNMKNLFHEIICWKGSTIAPVLNEAVNQIGNPLINSTNFYTHCQSIGINANNILIDACWDFVQYQYNNVCGGSITEFNREGFQIGSPWHGDILQAPVLFLAGNPAVTHRCLFPRWHPNINGGLFTLGGLRGTADGNFKITVAGKSINNIVSPSDIYDFLTMRFWNCAFTGNGINMNPNAWVIDDNLNCKGRHRGVKYWGHMRKVMDKLVSMGIPGFAADPNPQMHTKRLMSSVLSSEVIFWGSMDGAVNMTDTELQFFWNNYTSAILNQCGACILVLVGRKALNTFSRISETAIPMGFSGRVPAFCGNKFYIAAITDPSSFEPDNHAAVIANVIASGDVKVTQALHQITSLY